MKWSPQQSKALDAVGAWLKDSDAQVFRLFGYAGTGKTTLAKHLAQDVRGTWFAAYTGKAAHVLRQKGCLGATTIHSLIYNPSSKSAQRLKELEQEFAEATVDTDKQWLQREIEKEKENLRRPSFTLNLDSQLRAAELLVIDECSMVDRYMGEDLLSFGCKVLVLGDPAQLPPVKGGGYFTDHEPNVLLTDVHRQAKDNPIIEMATAVREGRPLTFGAHGTSSVISKSELRDRPEIALEADQVLVGMNRTRHAVNKRLRDLKGFTDPLPMKDDRLVCIRNNHDLGLLNGSIWEVDEIYDTGADPLSFRVRNDDGDLLDVSAHRSLFEGGKPEWWERSEAEEFEFGYGLTVHKSQGSEWPSVLVINEAEVFKSAARRWLYTAVTRAAEKLVVAA
jgi:exodeoxyribonuclease-5